MYINWSKPVSGPDGVPIPTYGNYGGPGYSNGEILSSPNQSVDYSATPVDALDSLFRAHDMVYDSPSTLVRAEGDLALIMGIEHLSQTPMSGEESLYAGAALIFAVEQLTVTNGHPELLSARQLAAAATTSEHDIAYGLTHLDPSDVAGGAGLLAHSAESITADVLSHEAFPSFVSGLMSPLHNSI
ncbi:hypothetical protein [Methylobacterium nodulans]|uniref:Uncharacterized protein n=1 Tax=Methylobacterium nodulans (strain LMG 21967 / CNCM I-2342 / ORS 2060) TaxID=460265 RepID=B8IU96_METNO|nr:hypothetical protein [Methylobacterium nodulans]ACL55141.1 hypothetical protein Mnod_0092 [Methylobacterium nodulans ORS 2060]